MDNKEIGSEILKQLGGNKFIAMTGAKDIMAYENGLRFKLPRGFALNKSNLVIITLNHLDLYDIDFLSFNPKSLDLKPIESVDNVYGEDLTRIFTAKTGLDTGGIR